MASDPSVDDVKTYLGISEDTYDTQIGSILTVWNNYLNARLLTTYTESSEYDNVLKLGKLLVACGQVQARLPSSVMTATTATNIRMGSYSESGGQSSSQNVQAGIDKTLFEQGMEILYPYFDSPDQVLSTTADYFPQYQIERYDEDGNVTEPGTMEEF